MTHYWGEEGFDWGGLNDAINFMATYMKKRRVPVRDYKEKFGGVRIYTGFGWSMLHDLLYPGYVFNQYGKTPFGKWMWKMDVYYGASLMGLTAWLVVPWHKRVYRNAYKLAIKRWPHLREEILDYPDYPELLRGL